jgi:hypothetical protein
MAILEQKITLRDSCRLIGRAKDIFAPLKETITNSLDSIAQRKKTNEVFIPSISVSVHFKTSKDMLGQETHELDFMSVEDNGIGFTSENLDRFKKLATDTKGLNNRGTGKVQIFCRFNEIEIVSSFNEAGKSYELKAGWKITGDYEGAPVEISNPAEIKTIVKMSGFNGDAKEQEFFLRYLTDLTELKRDVLKRFLLRLWIGAGGNQLTLTVKVFLEKRKKGEFTLDQSNIPEPDKVETVLINTEQAQISSDKKDRSKTKIEWASVDPKHELIIRRFKLSSTDMDENVVYMCSKDIVVEPFSFPAARKSANFNGFRYIASISGDLLDDPMNVKQSADGFMFRSKKETEAELKEGSAFLFNPEDKFIFWEEIKKQVGWGLSKTYDDVEGLKEARDNDIVTLAKQYGIPPEDAEMANISFNATKEEATEKLFETQAKRLAKQSIEIQKTYQELRDLETKKLDPTSGEYRKKFGELSSKLLKKIPQQNKDELARYIIRRDMVVQLLRLASNNNLDSQQETEKKKVEAKSKGRKAKRADKEGVIHDLIFRRRMKGVPNDLWIINEEFVHFDGCSETELNSLEINGEKLLRPDVDIDTALQAVGIDKKSALEWRPDIFLYPEEGKCILVEFKAPDVEVSLYLDQIQRYARMIANFSTRKFTQFYGFLIGETITRIMIPNRYREAAYGNYWIYPSEQINDITTWLPIADIYQEIIPLSEIAKRAEIRNKSFAEKLGITQDDLGRANELDSV